MTRDYLPHQYAALLSWLINFMSRVTENMSRFNIPVTELESLQMKVSDFENAYSKAENPNAGKADRLERKEKNAVVCRATRDFVNTYLRYNKAVTDEDRIIMGLTVADRNRTPLAAPVTMPAATIDSSIIMRLTVHYRDSGSTSRAKPNGMHGCEIRWSILPEQPEVTDNLLHAEISTRTPHTFIFEENQRGKTVYFRLRWENRRGAKGPWSELYMAIIP